MEKFEEIMLDEEMRGEFERRVSEEVQKARAEMEIQAKEGAQKAVAEYIRQESMTEDERISQKMKELEDRERRIVMMEMRARAAQMLAEKGLPVKLSEVMVFEGEKECDRGIEMLDEAFREAVKAEVVKKLGGEKPSLGMQAMDAADMSDEQYYSMKKRA